ncbi:MAG: hypothetical protein O3B87_02015 [bacterium]|nr:hypothetical protein [bacterium]
MKIFELFIRHSKGTIIGLAVLVVLLILLIQVFLRTNTNPAPESSLVDDLTPIPTEIVFSPYPTIPYSVSPNLEYPVSVNESTIEFRPKSGTFIIYYKNEKEVAERDYIQFIASLGLSIKDFRTDYRSLKPEEAPHQYENEFISR